MKRVIVLMLLMALNIGALAQEIIFPEDFESGWPNAWAEVNGWSAFVVKDSTGKLVGPVVGWYTVLKYPYETAPYASEEKRSPVGVPIVAVMVGDQKVLLKAYDDRLSSGRKLIFEGSDCTGQAFLCLTDCGAWNSEDVGLPNAKITKKMWSVGEGNVLYQAEPPNISNQRFNSKSWNGNHCENTQYTGSLVWAAEPLVDLDTLFIPPFNVE